MKTTIIQLERMSIKQFADKHGLEMLIEERLLLRDFYAMFKHSEVKDGAMLCSTSGAGATHAEAVEDYARQISGKLLVFDAYLPTRREIQVPHLTATHQHPPHRRTS